MAKRNKRQDSLVKRAQEFASQVNRGSAKADDVDWATYWAELEREDELAFSELTIEAWRSSQEEATSSRRRRPRRKK